jgi:putative polyhydroxyalkanoate system protein
MTVTRKHARSDAEVRQIIEQIAQELSMDFGFDYGWKGSRLDFTRTGVNGYIESHPGEIEVHIRKSFFIPISDGFLREKVNEYMDQYL